MYISHGGFLLLLVHTFKRKFVTTKGCPPLLLNSEFFQFVAFQPPLPMFNQKPAFKFVIKSKIEVPSAISDKKETTVASAPNLDDRKRKRTEGSAPIATKKVV